MTREGLLSLVVVVAPTGPASLSLLRPMLAAHSCPPQPLTRLSPWRRSAGLARQRRVSLPALDLPQHRLMSKPGTNRAPNARCFRELGSYPGPAVYRRQMGPVEQFSGRGAAPFANRRSPVATPRTLRRTQLMCSVLTPPAMPHRRWRPSRASSACATISSTTG